MAFVYNVNFYFESKDEIPLSLIQKRLLSEFTNLGGFSLDVTSRITHLLQEKANLVPDSDPTPAVPADHADAGRPEDHAEPELAAPAVSDAPVVADDAPAGGTDTPAAVTNVTKEQLKDKLFELRDAKGSEAVKLVYAECGQGAKTLKTLDESLYGEVYARAVKYLAE